MLFLNMRAIAMPPPQAKYVSAFFWLVAFICGTAMAQTPSGPLRIDGQSGTVFENLHITSTTGACVTISNSSGVTIRNSEIGPCGGNGVVISGGSGIKVLDNYIHPEFTAKICCDSGDGVYTPGTTDLLVQGNVIAYGESNIEILNTHSASVIGNFVVNPRNYGGARGTNIQAWDSDSITIRNNYAYASSSTSLLLFADDQSDSINLGNVSGAVVSNNYVFGGSWASGCGIIADSGANNIQFLSNTLVDPGACGIGIADGTNQVVDSNQILNSTPVLGGGNTAIYVWKVNSYDPPCGPVQVTNNIASELKPDMVTESGFWNGGGCGPVTVSGNIFDSAARARLSPVSAKLAAPQIPPLPSACVVASPFSNQTSFPGCNGQTAPAPSPSAVPQGTAGPVSDGFNAQSLDTNLWTFVDPAGGSSYAANGGQLTLTVPQGSNHDPAFGGNNSARVMQPVGTGDFTIEVRFDSIPTLQYQFEGVIIQQDANNYLRFNFGAAFGNLYATASSIVSGAEVSQGISAITLPGGTQSLWMRITRAGSHWTETFSTGGDYSTAASFNAALTPTLVGPFTGNYSGNAATAPGFSAVIDYFSNTAQPAE
jgi:regulation of enolase protein 1 (concanavalin A-like superfamily)